MSRLTHVGMAAALVLGLVGVQATRSALAQVNLAAIAGPTTSRTPATSETVDWRTTRAVSKTLVEELNELDTMRAGGDTDFAAVDRKAQDMLQRWRADAEQGDIYFTWARVYAQSDILTHEAEVERLATKALELQKDPAKRAILYMDWGGALTLKTPPKQRDDPAVRAQVTKPFLMGLGEMVVLDLPEVAPERPPMTKGMVTADGMSDAEAAAVRAEQEGQRVALETVRLQETLIRHRNSLVSLTVSVYVDWAYAPRGPEIEELRKVATESLKNKAEVERVMTAAANAVVKRAATEKVWRERSQKQ